MKKRILSILITASLLLASISVFATSPASEVIFTDVKKGKWYTDAVNTVFEEGIMQGKSSEIVNGDEHIVFAPLANMTRAELVTILSRLYFADTDGLGKQLTFKDTKKKAWYADAVGWAVSKGLVNGYDDNTFRPNANVSRQELAVLLARFLKTSLINLPELDNPSAFTDAKKIPKWAREGAEVMRLTGIVGGDENGNFNPTQSATRAEIAVMLTRYLTALDKAEDPMFAKFAEIGNLVTKEMGKISINLYLYERFTDYGHANSVSDQLLPQMGLNPAKYKMVANAEQLVTLNEAIVHGNSAADEEVGEFFIKSAAFFIRNNETGETTETKPLSFKINRNISPKDTNLVFNDGLDSLVWYDMKELACSDTDSLGSIDLSRFTKFFYKMSSGEDVTVGYIGGSITQGAVSGVQREHSWARISHEWLQYNYPDSDVKYVNAGIGGTPSDYGNFRAEPHLLSYDPDLIFIEFSVNDSSSREDHRESYEALLRRALNDEKAPAVVLVISALADDKAVERVEEFASYYGVPYVNVDKAIEYGVEAGAYTMKEYAPDGIHPYEWGHKLMGAMVIDEMMRILTKIIATGTDDTFKPVPENTLSGCTFDNLKFIGADDLTKDQIGSFIVIEGSADGTAGTYEDKSYLHGENDVKMSFTVEAKNLAVLHDCESMTVTINGEVIEITDEYDFKVLYTSDTVKTLNVEIVAHANTNIYGFSYN